MLIGIDASPAFRMHSTGTEYYAVEIIRHLLTLPAAEQHRWRLYVNAANWPEETEQAGIVDPRQSRTYLARYLNVPSVPQTVSLEISILPQRRMWTHRSLRNELIAQPPDVFFSPAHVIPFFLPVRRLPPGVVTIHDVGYHYFPEAHTLRQRLYLHLSTLWSTAAAARVITVSQATAADLHRHCGTPPQKVRTIYEAPPAMPAPGHLSPGYSAPGHAPQTLDDVRKQFGLATGSYVLYVGTIQPRKNIAGLLRAYARLCAQHHVPWDLLLVGKPGWLSEPIFELARSLALEEHLHFVGYVDDEWKDALLRHALFFCFPSHFEGFGLPVLEAQQRGTPVMTSNNSALPEIAGDGALLIDPLDEEAMAQAMLQLSQDEALRQQLIEAGYQNVKRFSWQKAAEETLAVLEEAARSRETTDR